jgi:hypothetical protein
MKIKLIKFGDDNFNHILTLKFNKVVTESFDVEVFDDQTTYDASSTIFCVSLFQFNKNRNIIKNLVEAGYKVVIENLHEGGFGIEEPIIPRVNNVLTITCSTVGTSKIHVPMFFWYNLHKPFTEPIHVIDDKTLNREYKADKKFLMLMNGRRNFRDQIYTKFIDIFDDGYYSYYERGIKIFNDKELNVDLPFSEWDRYVNIDWFNRTQFSIVVETTMNSDGSVFLTEKTMKPLALKHPFIILGDSTSLALLKSVGFETFENIFDESYDLLDNGTDRINSVYDQVKNYTESGYSKMTKDKLEHNYNLFHNAAEVNRRFKQDIIDPILEFADATT